MPPTTAGASSRRKTYTLKNGLYAVHYAIKAYEGYLDRLIERRGLEPDVPLRQKAEDLAAGRDTVLQAAVAALANPRRSAKSSQRIESQPVED